MQMGSVKWWDDSRGFGFIAPDAGGRDLFVHFSDVSGVGYRTLQNGQRVRFDEEQGSRGPKAINVADAAEPPRSDRASGRDASGTFSAQASAEIQPEASQPRLLTPPSFCAYASGECDQSFENLAPARGLFLYASKPTPIAATVAGAAKLLDAPPHGRYLTWRDMDIAGHMIFCEICKSIRAAVTVYADVTTLNFNLLFEIGFAIGLGVPVRPIRDPTYAIDKKHFDALGVLDTLGYVEFTNAPQLADYVREAPESAALPATHTRSARQTPLFLLNGPIETDGAVRLMSLIKKSRIGFRTHDSVETPRLSLHVARREVASSFGVVAHLLSPSREGATTHNALCAFIAGLAAAEQKPVLMLQEEAVEQPIDYRDIVKSYDSADQIPALLTDILGQVVEALQKPTAAPPPALASILDELDLGNVAAENEISGLRQYFVRTGNFRQVRQGHAQLVVGRKGAGKTATFYGLRQAVKRGREVLVLDMKPRGAPVHALARSRAQGAD